MSGRFDDLADLVTAHRRAADRVFESEMVKMRLRYGDHAVAVAMQIAKRAEERERISISGERRRHQQEIADARRSQRLRQRRDRGRSPGPLEPLPPGWR